MTKAIERTATDPTASDPRWARIVARDRAADGLFWYSVSTTGIYCRPSCPSRTANAKNVSLHDTLASAQATGFRACKRCNPDGVSQETENLVLVAKACNTSCSRPFSGGEAIRVPMIEKRSRAQRSRRGGSIDLFT